MRKSRSLIVLTLPFIALSGACARKDRTGVAPRPSASASAAASTTARTDVVAKVNGKPITEAEVRRELGRRGRQPGNGTDRAKQALEAVIGQELAYQKALAEGLDADPGYQRQVQRLEAEMRAVKRKALADLLYRRELAKSNEVSDSEVQAYFDKNASKLRAQLHVWQILVRSEQRAKELEARLKGGESFEAVARRAYPPMQPGDPPPWDSGFLDFARIPGPWRSVVYDLAPGQTSGIVAGPNHLYWILKLVARRDEPGFTFDKAKPAILAAIRNERAETLRARLDEQLRKDAKIEYLSPPTPPGPDDDAPVHRRGAGLHAPGRPPMPVRPAPAGAPAPKPRR